MKKPESLLYKKLIDSLEAYPIKFHRIENEMDLGTPDVYYTSMDNEGWIELKVVKSLPKLNTTRIKIPFRPGQYGWLKSRYKLNRRTTNMLIIQIDDVLFVFVNNGIRESYSLNDLLSYCVYQNKMNFVNKKELFRILDGGA